MNNLGTIRLETENCILRRFQEKDYIEMYNNWAKYEECSRYFPWNPIENLDMAKTRITQWIENYQDSSYYQWGIELKENDELIGVINLHNVDIENNSAETSYILSPRFWGKGIMREVLLNILKFAFLELDLNRVQADCFEGNYASKKVLERCGMICEGVSRERYFKNNEYINSTQYAILKRDYKNLANMS